MRTSYTFLRADEPAPAVRPAPDEPPLASAIGSALLSTAPLRRETRLLSRPNGAPGAVTPPLPPLVYRVSDSCVALGALLAALILSNLGAMPSGLDQFLAVRLSLKNLLLLALVMGLWRVICRLCGLYDWARLRSHRYETRRALLACAIGTAIAVVFPLTSASGAFNYASLGLYWLVTSVGIIGARQLLRATGDLRRPPKRNVLIAGSGPRALEVERRLRANQAVIYHVVGFVDSFPPLESVEARARLVATLEDLPRFLMHSPVDEVVLALPLKSRYAETEHVVETCEALGIAVTLPADVLPSSRAEFRPSGSLSLPSFTLGDAPDGIRLAIKRGVDLLGASAALVLLVPVMLLAALAIKLTSRGPVLFVQERYGYNRRRFRMYKFRTMRLNAEAQQESLEYLNEAPGPLFKIRRDPRLTAIGGFLRRSSIDELPQLLNVLRGDMSLVGPRPMSVRDALRLTEAALTRRFGMRPGITGLWQVRGRCSLDYDSWVTYDLQYVAEWSLSLDLKILALTLPAVLRGTGAA